MTAAELTLHGMSLLLVALCQGLRADWGILGRESMSLPYDRAMPYELKALECALAAGLRILSRDWADLDAEARTPLERLTHKVTYGRLNDLLALRQNIGRQYRVCEVGHAACVLAAPAVTCMAGCSSST